MKHRQKAKMILKGFFVIFISMLFVNKGMTCGHKKKEEERIFHLKMLIVKSWKAHTHTHTHKKMNRKNTPLYCFVVCSCFIGNGVIAGWENDIANFPHMVNNKKKLLKIMLSTNARMKLRFIYIFLFFYYINVI